MKEDYVSILTFFSYFETACDKIQNNKLYSFGRISTLKTKHEQKKQKENNKNNFEANTQNDNK